MFNFGFLLVVNTSVCYHRVAFEFWWVDDGSQFQSLGERHGENCLSDRKADPAFLLRHYFGWNQ